MSGPNDRPWHKPSIVLYLKLHYATRIKPDFDKLWAGVKDTAPAKSRVAMSQDYVRDCWAKESEEFRAGIDAQAHEMHRVAIEEWKARRNVPENTAEKYHKALEGLNKVGIPLADALSERLGVHVVIMVVGPVGKEEGEVMLRT
ncbi:hypothetical protein B0H17DRAFT_1199356 [Mycena rosella]|uniref:Uncharacterized protein n=1 Tax=Mycena rosella TaxID=1033263 RepID=A0AAD7GLZ7_MYCRO|nr:hypothetical protein B0H17DRAFT_1199356 [Mycena rosella]